MAVGQTCYYQLATWQHFFLYLSTHSTVGYSVRFFFLLVFFCGSFGLHGVGGVYTGTCPYHYTPLTSLDETSSFDLLSSIWNHTCNMMHMRNRTMIDWQSVFFGMGARD